MQLSILDRVLLLNVLPPAGDILSLRITRKLREDLSFSEAEFEEFELTQAEGFVQWNTAKNRDKDVEIGTKAKRLIVEALTNASKEKRLTEQHIAVYDKFVDEGDE